MKRKFMAVAVSLAVLFGTAVNTVAGTMDVRDGDVAGKVGTDIGGGKMHLNVAKKASERVVAVSLGDSHSGAITEDGSLYMWGSNGYGELGDGTNEDSNQPVKTLENMKAVSLGDLYSGAITEDGSLYMWGANKYGELGDGTNEERNSPVKVLDNVKAVSLGKGHSGAITEGGSLYMWGSNGYGELGDGTNENRNSPVKVLDNVKAVSLGAAHSGAITEDGSLYMWGHNEYGELGDGTKRNRNSPVKVLDNVKAVSLGAGYSGVIMEDGSLYMWGSNGSGELGDGTEWNQNSPVKVLDNVKAASLGKYYNLWSHSGAITEDGSLYMWGSNGSGELGDGTREDRNSPVKVLDNVKAASLGWNHSGAITEDGSLYMWGSNGSGELGDGTNENRNNPVKINVFLAKKAAQKITYRSSAIKKGRVAYGRSFFLNAKTTGAGKLTYKSSNPKVLSVNSKGKVTVKGYGPATVKIKASGGNGYKAAVRKFKLTAVPARGRVTKAVQENGIVRFKWKAEETADGYEYATAYNSKFSGQSKKKTKKTGLALTKYKTGTKKMFIKVRTYKKIGKKTYYGKWSKIRLLRLKKVRKSGESSYAIAN